MGYKVYYEMSDGSTNDTLLDEIFDTEEEADEAARQAASEYAQGGGYLDEAGEDFCEEEIEGWYIAEV